MVKVKYQEYVRLLRLVTGVTKRRIWDLLRNNQNVRELVDRVPEEFEKWVLDVVDDLNQRFTNIETEAKNNLEKVKNLSTRKDQALAIQSFGKAHRGVVFAMLDHKPYTEIIWKLIKPEPEPPFREDL